MQPLDSPGFEHAISTDFVLLDPDGRGTLFETPIAGPLPEGLNFVP